MQKHLHVFVLLLFAMFANAQITIGGGTTTSTMPIGTTYHYSYTQQILPQAGIGAASAGTITGITFYLSPSASLANSQDWVVYMGHTTKSLFDSTSDWIPVSQLTQVFSGAVSQTGGEVNITFTTPFAYDNVNNLVLAVDENTSGDEGAHQFYTYSGGSNTSLYYENDTTNPDPNSPPTGTRSTTKSVMTLHGLTVASAPACPTISNFADAQTNVSVLPNFSWSLTQNSSGYRITIGTFPGGSDVLNNFDVGNVSSYQLTTPLSYSTQYYYSISSYNAAGSSTCTPRSFTTAGPPPPNDECSTATVLTPQPDLVCINPTSSTTLSATASSATLAPCTGTADDDVWFSFVATSSSHQVSLTNIVSVGTSTSTTLYTQVFSGNCGTLTNVICDTTDASATAVNTTIGQTYYVRVYTSQNGGNYGTSFDICVLTIPSVANDQCSTAVPLPVDSGLTCISTTGGTTLYATNSNIAVSPCSGTADDDVWYSFVATAPSHVVTLSNVQSVGTSTSTSLYLQVMSGTCGNLTSVLCDTSYASPAIVTDLTVGQTYYLRVYSSSNGSNYAIKFDICVSTPPIPANDNCSTATNVPVNPDLICTNVVAGTTLYATDSGIPIAPCTGNADDDVWYSFVATNSSHTVTLLNIVSAGTSTSTTMYMQILSGTCGTLSSMLCDTTDASGATVHNLTVGQTYFVRVYNSSSGTNYANTFEICVTTPPAPPSNDECTTSIPLQVNSDVNCINVTSGTTLWATDSGITTCSGTGDDDVWYSFVATNSSHTVSLQNIVSVGATTSTTMYMEIFSGSCGTLTSLICDTTDATGASVHNLTVGQTYYVRVYNSGAGATYANSFEICVTTPPTPPSNDDCSGAISVPVNPDMTCASTIAGTTLWATDSGFTTCSGSSDDDVWYSFVATGTTHNVGLTNIISVGTTTTTTLYLEVFSGTCGTLTSQVCDTTDASPATVSNLTIGQTYYVRVYTSSAGSAYACTFDVCITTPPTGPANDECANAVSLIPSSTASCVTPTSGTTLWATESLVANSPCSGIADDDVWYSFVASSTEHTVNLTNIVSVGTTNSTSVYLQVFSGSCGSLNTILCDTTYASPVDLGGLTVGQTYYIRVYNSVASNTYANTFDICVTTPSLGNVPTNDNCANATTLTAGSSFSQFPLTGTTAGSLNDGPNPTCEPSTIGNVWYTVIVPTNGSITLETQSSSTTPAITNSVISVFTGSCGALTQIGCDDDSGDGSFSLLSLTGLTPGATLYVNVSNYSTSTSNGGNFQVAAYDSSLSTNEIEISENTVKVYPNPFTEILNIADVREVASVSITDMAGRVVKTIAKPTAQLQLGDLKSGMYLVTLKYKNGTVKSVKAIKK